MEGLENGTEGTSGTPKNPVAPPTVAPVLSDQTLPLASVKAAPPALTRMIGVRVELVEMAGGSATDVFASNSMPSTGVGNSQGK